jgi:hypothetical protein
VVGIVVIAAVMGAGFGIMGLVRRRRETGSLRRSPA